MWNLTGFASEFFGAPNPVPETRFEREYACYPVSFAGREPLEKGNKILLPQSALNTLARMNVTWPMLFEVSNPALHRETHSGVLEFSAEEGTCYMPYWMMKNLVIREGELVKIVNTSLPKGTYVKLQPITTDFLDISDHRAVLEHSLRYFATLTVGDNIIIQHNNKNYEIEVLECRPGRAISIIETDVQVDFAPPKDYVEPQRITPTPSTASISESTVTTQPDSETQGKEKELFKLYGGVGSRLDGRPPGKSSVSQPASLIRKPARNPEVSSTEFHCPSHDVDGESGREDDLTTEPWKSKLRLPGGVRTSCADYSRLIAEGRLPGVIGKAKRSSGVDVSIRTATDPNTSSSSLSSSTNPFVLFGGEGRHSD